MSSITRVRVTKPLKTALYLSVEAQGASSFDGVMSPGFEAVGRNMELSKYGEAAYYTEGQVHG